MEDQNGPINSICENCELIARLADCEDCHIAHDLRERPPVYLVSLAEHLQKMADDINRAATHWATHDNFPSWDTLGDKEIIHRAIGDIIDLVDHLIEADPLPGKAKV